jgi:hypothetical protein
MDKVPALQDTVLECASTIAVEVFSEVVDSICKLIDSESKQPPPEIGCTIVAEKISHLCKQQLQVSEAWLDRPHLNLLVVGSRAPRNLDWQFVEGLDPEVL